MRGGLSAPPRTAHNLENVRITDRFVVLDEGRVAEGLAPECPDDIDLVDLRRVYALVFLEHGTRRLHIAGVRPHIRPRSGRSSKPATSPSTWARALTRCASWSATGTASTPSHSSDGIETLKTAPRAPRMNAHCERGLLVIAFAGAGPLLERAGGLRVGVG